MLFSKIVTLLCRGTVVVEDIFVRLLFVDWISGLVSQIDDFKEVSPSSGVTPADPILKYHAGYYFQSANPSYPQVCVCVCVCVCVYMCVCVHVCFLCVCLCVCVLECLQACMKHIYIKLICVFVPVCRCICTCIVFVSFKMCFLCVCSHCMHIRTHTITHNTSVAFFP